MASQIYLSSKDSDKWTGRLKCIVDCPVPNCSHFAIIVKGNIIERIKAEW